MYPKRYTVSKGGQMNMTNNYFKTLKNEGIPFMEGRDKGDVRDLLGKTVNIMDFGFIRGDNGEYAVFCVKGEDKLFYCGGKAVTEILKRIKEDGMKEELAKQDAKILEVTSKTKRKYITIEF